ncbi:MAG: hypothetical protein ACI4MR_01935 [Candidatus Aphodomorpha sp.]
MLLDVAIVPDPIAGTLSGLVICIAFAVIAGLCFMACYLIRRALLREKERKDASK